MNDPRSPGRVLDPATRQAYLAALVARYHVLDLTALTPESEDDHVPILLRQVFVPQRVRNDPPPVELPRDLLRRLVEAGELTGDDLPAEFDEHDREMLAKAREAHTAETPRPVAELLGDVRRRHVVLLGDPGAGKSSLLRYVALSLAAETPPPELAVLAGHLPVVVELRAYASPAWRTGRWSDGTLLDFLDYLHAQQGLGLPRDAFEAYLANDGRAVVMFDGLDEIFDPAQREETTQRIVAFARQFPLARVIVTSRVIGYRRRLLDGAGFSLHTLQDLDDSEVEAFVARWYAIAGRGDSAGAGDRTSRLLAALERSPSARDLAGNPMLLTILAVIGRRRELPKERHRVYQHAVEVLTQHWDLNRAVRDTRVEMDFIDEEDKRELLRRIARRMQGGRDGVAGNHIHRDELLAEFQDYLLERYPQPAAQAKVVAKAMLEQFRDRNFILSRFGPGLYGFVHRAFLEYCCADEIVYRFKESQELTIDELVTDVFAENATDPAWQEVLLLIAGMIHDRFLGTIIDHLLTLDETPRARFSDDAGRHWLLALRCLAEARNPARLTEQGRRVVARLVELVSATRLVGSTVESVGADHTVIEEAVPALREIGAQLPSRAYLDWFRRSPQPLMPRIRYLRVRGYGQGTRRVAEISTEIASILCTDSAALRSILLRRIVLEYGLTDVAAVERLGDTWTGAAGRTSLHHVLRTARRPEIRAAALTALTRHRDEPEVRDLLVESATFDRDDSVRLTALEKAAAEWPDERTRALLVDRLTVEVDHDVGAGVLMILAARWPDDRTRTLVSAHVTTDPRPLVRRAALTALAGTWPDAASRALTLARVEEDPSAGVRGHASELLAQTWPDDVTRGAIVRRATADVDDVVRATALKALAQAWPDEQTRTLVERNAAADRSPGVRTAAVTSLAEQWPDERACEVLTDRATADLSETVRDTALESVLRLQTDEAGRALAVGLTHDPNEDIRRTALGALATTWPDDRTRRLLVSAATDPDVDVRMAAVSTLGRVWPDEQTLALLLERVRVDAEWHVRRSVVETLAEYWRGDRVRAVLVDRAVTDPDDWVRNAALHAVVKKWPDDTTRSLLTDCALADPEPSNRVDALVAIGFGWPNAATRALLLRSARDDAEKVRAYAVTALVDRWPDDEAHALALELADADPHEDVRQAACSALSFAWPDGPSRELISRAAEHDPDADVRELCIEALATEWPDEPTRRLLVRRLTEDDAEGVRAATAGVLVRRWPDSEMRTVLTGRATRDPVAFVRYTALCAVIHCWPDAETYRCALEVGRNDPDEDFREHAVDAACLLSGLEVERRPPRLELVDADLAAGVRGIAMAMLVWAWPGPGTREFVTGRLRDRTDEEIRPYLLEQLAGTWCDGECQQLMIAIATHNDHPGVRKRSIDILAGSWPDAATHDALAERGASDTSADVRRAALTALVRLRPDPATRALVIDHALDDADGEVREEALEGLVRCWPDEETRQILAVRAAADDYADARLAAVKGIVRAWPDHPETRPALMRSLAAGCANEDYERDVAVALTMIWPDEETRAALTDIATSDAGGTARAAAARALSWRWPDAASRDVLTTLAAADPDEHVRADAMQTLARDCPDERTRTLLHDTGLTDPSTGIRQATVEALTRLWPDERTAAVLTRAADDEEDDEVRATLSRNLRALDRRRARESGAPVRVSTADGCGSSPSGPP